MKGQNGVQMQVHNKFLDFFKKIKNERIKRGKDNSGELSNKRLSLTIMKFFEAHPESYKIILNAEISKNEV